MLLTQPVEVDDCLKVLDRTHLKLCHHSVPRKWDAEVLQLVEDPAPQGRFAGRDAEELQLVQRDELHRWRPSARHHLDTAPVTHAGGHVPFRAATKQRFAALASQQKNYKRAQRIPKPRSVPSRSFG